jgi:tetratricopeptide (TPR) repeat protein
MAEAGRPLFPLSAARLFLALLVLPTLNGACARRDPDLELHRGRNAVALDRDDWARIHFARDLEEHPSRVESLRALGISWLSGYQRSLSIGIDAYRRYLERRPDDIEIRQRLVAALLLAGEWQAARGALGSLDESPASQRLRARAWLDSDPGAAWRAIEVALETEPSTRETEAVAARVYETLGDRQAALAHGLAALRLDPLDFETRYLVARLYAAQGARALADESLRLYRLASQVRHDGTMAPLSPAAELEILAQLAAAGAEDNPLFRRLRAEDRFRTGRFDAAVADVTWLRSRPDASLSDLLEFARWADNAGLRSVALDLLTQAAGQAPNDRGVLSSLAILDLRAGHLDAARDRVSRCLEEDPYHAPCHLLFARIALAAGQEEVALDHFSRAVDLAPWQADWRLEWAKALLAAGHGDAVRRAVDEAPETSPALEALAARYATPSTD